MQNLPAQELTVNTTVEIWFTRLLTILTSIVEKIKLLNVQLANIQQMRLFNSLVTIFMKVNIHN